MMSAKRISGGSCKPDFSRSTCNSGLEAQGIEDSATGEISRLSEESLNLVGHLKITIKYALNDIEFKSIFYS